MQCALAATHQVMESRSLPFECGLALATLEHNKMWQKGHRMTSEARSVEPCNFFLDLRPLTLWLFPLQMLSFGYYASFFKSPKLHGEAIRGTLLIVTSEPRQGVIPPRKHT